ncbi:MAG TPA: hypothetical protein VGL91_03925 [Acidobacteriota bacterium]|jgi:hypothetical protein
MSAPVNSTAEASGFNPLQPSNSIKIRVETTNSLGCRFEDYGGMKSISSHDMRIFIEKTARGIQQFGCDRYDTGDYPPNQVVDFLPTAYIKILESIRIT